MIIYEDTIQVLGLDIKKISSIARRISKAGREAKEAGIFVFGGGSGFPGDGQLRYYISTGEGQPYVLADLDGSYDGGDGGSREDDQGHLRGE